MQESVEHDSDTDSELEEISLDEASAHAPRWVKAIASKEKTSGGNAHACCNGGAIKSACDGNKKMFSQDFARKTGL